MKFDKANINTAIDAIRSTSPSDIAKGVTYGVRLVGTCLENITHPQEKVFQRLEAIGEIFFDKDATFKQFRRGVQQASELFERKDAVAASVDFRQAFMCACEQFGLEIAINKNLKAKIDCINQGLLLAKSDSPRYSLENELSALDEYQDLVDVIKKYDLTEGELDTALRTAVCIMDSHDTPCPKYLLLQFGSSIYNLESVRDATVSPELYESFFQLCVGSNAPVDACSSLVNHAIIKHVGIGQKAANHLATMVTRCVIQGRVEGQYASTFVGGLLYSGIVPQHDTHQSPEQSDKERFDIFIDRVPVLLARLHKADPKLFDSQSIKGALKFFNADDSD